MLLKNAINFHLVLGNMQASGYCGAKVEKVGSVGGQSLTAQEETLK